MQSFHQVPSTVPTRPQNEDILGAVKSKKRWHPPPSASVCLYRVHVRSALSLLRKGVASHGTVWHPWVLHAAVLCGQLATVEALLADGAAPKATDAPWPMAAWGFSLG